VPSVEEFWISAGFTYVSEATGRRLENSAEPPFLRPRGGERLCNYAPASVEFVKRSSSLVARDWELTAKTPGAPPRLKRLTSPPVAMARSGGAKNSAGAALRATSHA